MIPIKLHSEVYSFLSSLIQADFIKSFIWTLKFKNNLDALEIIYKKEEGNDIIGELIIGDDPHNYEENKNI